MAADRAVRALDAAGLFADTGLEAAGSGLVEFCTLCDLPPVVACPGRDLGPVLALCARLAETFGVTADRLPMVNTKVWDLLKAPWQSTGPELEASYVAE